MVDDNGGRYLKICEESKETNVDCQTSKAIGDVRIVLIGRTGVGKSATGNTILGQKVFQSQARMSSVTKQCQRETAEIFGRTVTVVDTPGLFDTSLSNEKIHQEIMRCIELCAPGPHVFLLLIAVDRFSQDERETLQLIQMTFGQKAQSYTIVLFTRGDSLGDESDEDFIQEGDPDVQKLISDCGGRYHVFNNRDKNPAQVESLLKKIDDMVRSNDDTFYSNEMFQEVERTLKLIQQFKKREEEVKRQMEVIKAKYEAEILEYKEKLEEEKARGKIRELLLMVRENRQSKKHHTETEDTVHPKQLQYKTHLEKENNEKQKQKTPHSAKTDVDTEEESAQGATGGESDQHKKKTNKKASRAFSFVNITLTKKHRQQLDVFKKEHKVKETAGGEEKQEERKDSFSQDRPVMNEIDSEKEQENMDVPQVSEELRKTVKDKVLLQQMKEIEEHIKKMADEMNSHRETAQKYTEELKKNQERNAKEFNKGQKNKKSKCVLQ